MIRARHDRWFDRFRRTGEPTLLAQVFDATAPELWRVAAHLCRDRHAAEDAVQGAFLAAIEHRQKWDSARPLLPWLLGLLANRVREHRRRAARVLDAARLQTAGERDPAELVSHETDRLLASVTREVATGVRTEVVVSAAQLPTARLRGTLAPSGGVEPSKLQLVLQRGRFDVFARPESVHVQPDALSFETPPLPAGTYHLAVLADWSRTVAMRTNIEVQPGAVVDLGRIEIGTGTALFDVRLGDGSPVVDAYVCLTIAGVSPFSRWPRQTHANGIELADVPAATFDALVWGPEIAPVTIQVTTRIGERTTVPVLAARGTPTTANFMVVKDPRNMALVTIRRAGALLVAEVIDRADPYVRGFAAGGYRIEFEAFDGLHGATDFTVGSTPGQPIDVRLER